MNRKETLDYLKNSTASTLESEFSHNKDDSLESISNRLDVIEGLLDSLAGYESNETSDNNPKYLSRDKEHSDDSLGKRPDQFSGYERRSDDSIRHSQEPLVSKDDSPKDISNRLDILERLLKSSARQEQSRGNTGYRRRRYDIEPQEPIGSGIQQSPLGFQGDIGGEFGLHADRGRRADTRNVWQKIQDKFGGGLSNSDVAAQAGISKRVVDKIRDIAGEGTTEQANLIRRAYNDTQKGAKASALLEALEGRQDKSSEPKEQGGEVKAAEGGKNPGNSITSMDKGSLAALIYEQCQKAIEGMSIK